MTPANFRILAIEPGLTLLPPEMNSNEAKVILMAIAGQESSWTYRTQDLVGTAVGYWQFQQDGVADVITAEPTLTQSVLAALDIDAITAYPAIEYNDMLACAFARLLLWSDPDPLPAIGDVNGAWAYYVANWQPGAPDRARWAANYATAVATVTG